MPVPSSLLRDLPLHESLTQIAKPFLFLHLKTVETYLSHLKTSRMAVVNCELYSLSTHSSYARLLLLFCTNLAKLCINNTRSETAVHPASY